MFISASVITLQLQYRVCSHGGATVFVDITLEFRTFEHRRKSGFVHTGLLPLSTMEWITNKKILYY